MLPACGHPGGHCGEGVVQSTCVFYLFHVFKPCFHSRVCVLCFMSEVPDRRVPEVSSMGDLGRPAVSSAQWKPAGGEMRLEVQLKSL